MATYSQPLAHEWVEYLKSNLVKFPLGKKSILSYTIITAKEKQFNLKENKMLEEKLVEIVNAIDNLTDNDTTIEFNVETHNLISWLGESLDSIANTLKKIEAKMK